MITKVQLEQRAIQWFQDAGWNYANGADHAPEGATLGRRIFGRAAGGGMTFVEP